MGRDMGKDMGQQVPADVVRQLWELGRALSERGISAERRAEWSAVLQQLAALLLGSSEVNGAVGGRDLLDIGPDGYLLTDQAGVIEEVNREATELLQSRKEFLLGKPFPLYLAEGQWPAVYSVLNR